MQELLDACGPTRGHFLYESGHHGDLWLDLERLLADERRTRPWISALAKQAAACKPEVVLGPVTGGAFVAEALAVELGAGFVFADRFAPADESVRYRIPNGLRKLVRGRRVLLVDDAINAGSAVKGALADLNECGGMLVGLGCLLALGEAAAQIATERGVPLFALEGVERGLWSPEACPLCRSGTPLLDLLVR